MENRDRRVKLAKELLENGKIESLADLMILVSTNFVREVLGNQNHKALNRKAFNPEKFTIEELYDLSKAIGCDPNLLIQLALRQLQRSRASEGATGNEKTKE